MKKKILSFVFTFVSFYSFGQSMHLITDICDPQSDACVIPHINIPNATPFIVVPAPTSIGGVQLQTDAGANFYVRSFFPPAGAGVQFHNYIYRKNNKWIISVRFTWSTVDSFSPGAYETFEGGNSPNPPCLAEWHTSGGTNIALEFTGLGCQTTTMLCNIETHQKLINLAAISGLNLSEISVPDGLREGSIIYNQSQQQLMFYNGNSWNAVQSPQKRADVSVLEVTSDAKIGGVLQTNSGIRVNIVTFSQNLIINSSHSHLVYDGIGGHTITLPSLLTPTTVGQILEIKNVGTGNLGLSLPAYNTYTNPINTIPPGSKLKIVSNGTRYIVM